MFVMLWVPASVGVTDKEACAILKQTRKEAVMPVFALTEIELATIIVLGYIFFVCFLVGVLCWTVIQLFRAFYAQDKTTHRLEDSPQIISKDGN